MQSRTSPVARIFLTVIRQDTQNAVAPSMTSAKIGIPAREIVSILHTAAAPMATTEKTRINFGSVETAAATKMGATRHTYMDRLFSCSRVPGTRLMPPINLCLSAHTPSRQTAQPSASTRIPNSR